MPRATVNDYLREQSAIDLSHDLLLGSVAQRVLSGATQPVLLVK